MQICDEGEKKKKKKKDINGREASEWAIRRAARTHTRVRERERKKAPKVSISKKKWSAGVTCELLP